VGIGTDSPSFYGLSFKNIVTISSAAATTDYAVIELAGGSAAGGGIQFGNQTVRQAGIFSLNGSDLAFYTNPTNSGSSLDPRLTITSGGVVNVNTTGSGTQKLQVIGGIQNWYDTNFNRSTKVGYDGIYISGAQNGYLDSPQDWVFWAGGSQKMRIASGGIVGIGVVPKTDPFGVGGNQFQMLQFGSVGCIGSYDNAGEAMFSNNVYVSSTVGTFAPITTGNGSAIFCYTDRIDFKSAVNNGDGTMSTIRRVSIADGTTAGHSTGALELYGAGTTLDNGSAAFVSHYLDTGNNYSISTGFKNVSQDIVIINSSAGVRLEYADTSWVSNSDENIKENIVPLDNVLDKIKNIRCVNYNLKDEEIYKKRLGFIAQDFQEDFEEVVGKSSDGILGLRYTETIPILMKAIQEQQTAIQEQQTIINTLIARIDTLENN